MNLQDAYDTIETDQLNTAVKDIVEANNLAKRAKCWKFIDAITGRKNTKKCIIKATNNDERVDKWYEHFKNFLGTDQYPEYEEFISETIFAQNELNIPETKFTSSEYLIVNNKLIDGKASGPDNIAPEALQYCKFDEITLKFATEVLMNHEKPKQWSTCRIIPVPQSGNLNDVNKY